MTVGKYEQGTVLCVTPGLARLVGWWLVLSLTACGAPVSEKAPGQMPSGSKGATAGAEVGVGAAQRSAEPGNAPGSSSQNDRKAVSVGQAASDADERDNRPIPGVPDMVVKELGSADPRDRYRALEHWEKKDNNASLDPVFEAMEDEDEAVRAKATAIVEQRWAEEQKRERG